MRKKPRWKSPETISYYEIGRWSMGEGERTAIDGSKNDQVNVEGVKRYVMPQPEEEFPVG